MKKNKIKLKKKKEIKCDTISTYKTFFEMMMKQDRSCSIYIVYNRKCIKCNAVNETMILVGCICFCDKCCLEVFGKDENSVKNQKELYSEWLKIYNADN